MQYLILTTWQDEHVSDNCNKQRADSALELEMLTGISS